MHKGSIPHPVSISPFDTERTSFRFQTRSHESAKKASLRIRFVIVGGGAAGLSCAVALRRVGHEVIVLEKGPNFIGVRTAPVPAIPIAHPMSHTAKQVPRNPYATQHDKSFQLLGHA
jgi:NADPH-dependent glutamate synthase beta subunit-like oxidoreductase